MIRPYTLNKTGVEVVVPLELEIIYFYKKEAAELNWEIQEITQAVVMLHGEENELEISKSSAIVDLIESNQ